MKKLLLTMIVALALGGTVFAQQPETHWPGFDYHAFEMQGSLYASIMVNGEPVYNTTENWEMMEVAAFVGDELRKTAMFLTDEYVQQGYDVYPTLNGEAVYYTTPGEPLTFKMYNHATGVEYGECQVLWYGEEMTIYTGEEHWEGLDDPENPLFLNFIGGEEPTTFTKTIEGYGTGTGNWYLIATPIDGIAPADVANMVADPVEDYDLYAWDGTTEEMNDANELLVWRNFKADENYTTLVSGKGYLYANKNTVTLSFQGTPYTGTGSFPLTYNADKESACWNLVGNPYGDTAYIGREFYVMNSGGTGFVASEVNAIAPMEGVFVVATNADDQVVFTTEEPGEKNANLALNLSQGQGVIDRAIVRFGKDSQLPKFQLRNNNTKVYIPMDGEDFAVVSAGEMGEMPVSFKAESNGSYTLSFTSQEVSFNYLHLIDNMTGADVDLLVNPSYSFDANTTDYANRFKLVFATGSNSNDNFSFYSNGSFIISNEGEATLQVVDVTGRILNSETINGSASVHVNAAAGVYMLRLINGDNVKVQKVVVK